MTDQTIIAIVAMAGAALTMALGAIGAAIGESRIGAAAMDALARQPDEASSITRTLVRQPGDGGIDGHLLPGDRVDSVVCQSLYRHCGRIIVSPTLTTFLFEAANFLVLAAALGWLFFKPVRQALADRREKFEADNRQAAEKLAEAEKTQQEIDATRANLQSELNELRTRELEAARRQAEQILAEARVGRSTGTRDEPSPGGARCRTRSGIPWPRSRPPPPRRPWAIAEADRWPRSAVRSDCSRLASNLAHCRQQGLSPVRSSRHEPLSPDQLASLKDALGPAADAADFRTVDGLGDGVRISTGKGLIDASVNGLVQFASQSLVKEMSRRANNHNPLQSINDA